MHNEEIEKLHTEIIEFYKEVKEALSPNDPYNDYYLGYQVYYSPIIFNPKIMFIGINPGPGKTEVEDIDAKTEFAYIDGGFTLARENENIFNRIGKIDVLKNKSFKTNYYYLISKSENHLNDCFYKLPKEIQSKFEIKSEEFTLKFIDLLNPEIIVCESSSVYHNMKKLLKTDTIDLDEKNCYLSKSKKRNYYLVGYGRRFSFIRNKEGLAKIIDSLL